MTGRPVTRESAARRIKAILLRHIYVLRTSWPRLLELAYWPTVQMVLWGFITTFFLSHSSWVAQAAGVLISAVLLWDVLFRANLGVSLTFMEEMWSRNLGQLFVSPLRPHEMVASLLQTANSTAMIFFIVLGAAAFNSFLAFAQLPQEAADWVLGQGFSPHTVLLAILLLYLVLGCFMDSLSMILLTVPIFFPVVSQLDFGMGSEDFALWFGILVLIVVEVGLITPPVGMNLFIINSMAEDVPLRVTYAGTVPFLISDMIRVAILVLFPAITLALVWL